MIRTAVCVVVLLIASAVRAQNLVPNPGFEEYTALPDYYGQWNHCLHWSSLGGEPDNMGALASPDYLHDDAGGFVGLPNNTFGQVFAHSGDAIMGIAIDQTWTGETMVDFREYISVTLDSPMLAGVSYTVSFWMTNGLGSYYGNASCDHLGVCFSLLPPVQNTYEVLPVTPQLEIPGEVWETDWQLFSFTIVPTEEWHTLTIGQFASGAETSMTQQDPSGFYSSYYFFDDVSVIEGEPGLTVTGDDLICAGDSATLSAWNDAPYTWESDAAPGTIFSTDSVVTVAPSETTTYTVHGASGSATFTVQVDPVPVFAFGDLVTLCAGQWLFSETEYPGATYTWSTGSHDWRIVPPVDALYWLGMTLGACSYTDSVMVTLQENCTPHIEMPNVFTPDGNDANELFRAISLTSIQEAQLRMLNRWGDLIHEGTLQQGWDGMHAGNPCSEGVYFWIVDYTASDGTTGTLHGSVTLVR